MTTPTLEKYCRTYWAEKHDQPISWDGLAKSKDRGHQRIVSEIRAGLRAVIETHFVPMLADAWNDGADTCPSLDEFDRDKFGERYADRIKRLILEPAAPQDEKG